MTILSNTKNVDKQYAALFVKKFCGTFESKKYPDDFVIDSADKAIHQISDEDSGFADAVKKALHHRYPEIKKFQN